MEEARKEVGEIIDRLAVIYDEEDVKIFFTGETI